MIERVKADDQDLTQISRKAELLLKAPAVLILEDMPWLAFATDSSRRIVWMNLSAKTILDGIAAIGRRPGEAIGCVNAAGAGGCGGTPLCAFCGLNSALNSALSSDSGLERCMIQRDEAHGSDSIELLVWAKPIVIYGERLVIVTARDTSDERRHEVLERVFYHDIGNTVAGLRSMTELLDSEHPSPEFLGLLKSAAEQLSEEIESQRGLKAAEQGRLEPEKVAVSAHDVIHRAVAILKYQLHGKGIVIDTGDSGEPDVEAIADLALLRRVIVNMLKNALEASKRGDVIRVRFEPTPDEVVFRVSNPAVIDPESRLRIFQRSFSTKGRGRGLGTYSMRLITERYLGGRVGFTSEPGKGTTFWVTVPRRSA